MNNKILVVDDEPHILELVNYHLTKEGYSTVLVDNGNKAIKKLNEDKYDAVILDWMLPEVNGIDILKWIRNKSNQTNIPVLFLTAKSDEFDTVLALEIGADEYISKPFRNKELVARLKALLRRTKNINNSEVTKQEKEWTRNGFVINELNRSVFIHNENLEFSRKEYELFILLIKHPSRVFTRDELLNTIWGYEYYGGTRTVDVHIRQIRKKLVRYEREKNIATVHGVGYKWIEMSEKL